MSDFRTKLQDLNPGDFLDLTAELVREQQRRASNKSPAEMTDAENRSWAADQIKRAEQAKADAARRVEDGDQ